VLLSALRHPLRRDLLRRYVEATEPLGSAELARAAGQPLSIVSHHVRELERCRAIQLAGEDERCGPAAYLYEPSWWVRLTPRVVIALGLSPEEQRRRLDEHIAERREDAEFMERLKRRVEEDRPVLERLKESDGLGGSAD
jgi:hypothetical protein